MAVSRLSVKLLFLSLATDEAAIVRVAMRVRQAGHDIPMATSCRRCVAGMKNFHQVYQARVDIWQWFDNGGAAPLLLAEGGSP